MSEYGFGRGNIVLDKHDTAFVVLPNADVIAATAKSGWKDWKMVYTAPMEINKEAMVDRQRLAEDGVLSVAYQEASDVQTLTKQTPAAFRVADFRVQPGQRDRARDTEPQAPPVPYEGPQNATGEASASSEKVSIFSAAKAFDGNQTTRWVSNGTDPGDGPAPNDPETLTYTFAKTTSVSEVSVLPGSDYGPRGFAIEGLVNGSWTLIDRVEQDPTGASHRFDSAQVDAIRLVITSSYDPRFPDTPRNVQIAEVGIK